MCELITYCVMRHTQLTRNLFMTHACGKAPGILTGDESLAKHYVAQGCLFVAVGADQNVLRDSATALAQRFKS